MLKMFVWSGNDFGEDAGLVCALAHDVDEARKLAREIEEAVEYYYIKPGQGLDREPEIFDSPHAVNFFGYA